MSMSIAAQVYFNKAILLTVFIECLAKVELVLPGALEALILFSFFFFGKN
jgi:hypothetical protein